MSAELKGLDKMQRRLERMAQRVPTEVGRALLEEAHIERTESMKRTPVEFGALRASHEVEPPVVSGRDVSVKITVGGPSAPYAIYVHEDLDAHHNVGQAKFLESTIMESRPYMARRIAARIELNRLVR